MADLVELLSNNYEVALTPEVLRKLAESQEARNEPAEPGGFQIHRLSARLSPKILEEVIRRYEAGESARSLAKELGIAPSALLRLLRERNVVVRRRLVTKELVQELAQDYEAGMTVATIQTKHGLSHNAVLRALHRAGVEMRGTGRRPSTGR